MTPCQKRQPQQCLGIDSDGVRVEAIAIRFLKVFFYKGMFIWSKNAFTQIRSLMALSLLESHTEFGETGLLSCTFGE